MQSVHNGINSWHGGFCTKVHSLRMYQEWIGKPMAHTHVWDASNIRNKGHKTKAGMETCNNYKVEIWSYLWPSPLFANYESSPALPASSRKVHTNTGTCNSHAYRLRLGLLSIYACNYYSFEAFWCVQKGYCLYAGTYIKCHTPVFINFTCIHLAYAYTCMYLHSITVPIIKLVPLCF